MSRDVKGAASAAPVPTAEEPEQMAQERKPRKRKRPRRNQPSVTGVPSVAHNPAVLDWVRGQTRLGLTSKEIVAASVAGDDGWPVSGDKLSDGTLASCRAAIFHLEQVGASWPLQEGELRSSPRKRPRESGKRLRQLGIERKAEPSKLLSSRYEIVKMVGILEGLDLLENVIGDADGDTVATVHEELSLLATWLDSSLTVVVAHMDDARVLEKIRKLREDTQGRTPAEIATAQRLAAQLERKRDAKLVA